MNDTERHFVAEEYNNLPFAELSTFLVSKLEETKYPPTPDLVSKWIMEHQLYILENRFSKLCYVMNKPNKVKK